MNRLSFVEALEASGEPLVVLDGEGRYLFVNDAALSVLGQPRERLIGHVLWEASPALRGSPLGAGYERAIREQAVVTVEQPYPEPGRWFEVRVIPYRGLVYLHFRDVTARVRAEQREREREARERDLLADIFRQTPAFMAVLRGPRHVFAAVNPPFCRLVAREESEILGKPLAEAMPEVIDQGFVALMDQVYRSGEAFSGKEAAVVFRPVPGGPAEERFVDFTFQPLFDPNEPAEGAAPGAATGVLLHGADLTDRLRLEREREAMLAEARVAGERLRLAMESGGLGAWDADLAAGTLSFSEQTPPLYGRPRAAVTIPIREWVEEWLHPEERERIPAAFDAALRGEADPGVRFRTLWPDGETSRWVATRAVILRDARGTPTGAVGYTRDVTGERAQEAEREALLQRQREFMRDLVSSLSEGKFRLCLTDADLPAPRERASETVALSPPTLRVIRQAVGAAAPGAGLSPTRAYDLVAAVGEAAMNAVTHGGGGEAWVCADAARRVLQVWVRDEGRGISDEALPRVFGKGMSTAGSLGHGFWLILRSADRCFLLTGPGGTTVVLEQAEAPPELDWLSPPATDRPAADR